MSAVLPSVIAVLGTLLGSTVTHAFQRRTAERTARLTRDEKLRQERIDAYCGYAGALLEYRRVLVQRWFVQHENRVEEDTPELQEQVYKLRYAAHEAMFRAQMLTGSAELSGLAERTLEEVTALHRAEGRAELDEVRDASRLAIRNFVAATTPYIG
ncbi:hypothetical protein [Streptomyces silvisoli]|uniref:Uncharacterized protein n=1 Tax=Streptomyces silvisoli TaxID=3034235 RepID=A0ABT5ZV26_9ACTN|nr:hypothetical protein [Streptomyces silvisoli]MDF3293455.1 hypothetical protein [Streptomyces silvisoli]